MPILFSLAARNIMRNRARSALTFGAIFAGVAMTLLLSGFGKGLGDLMRDDVILTKVGALQVHKAGYDEARDGDPLDFDMEDGGALLQKITGSAHVTAAAPRIVFSGLINNGQDATMFVGHGIDPGYEYDVLHRARSEVDGSPISLEHPNGGIMGMELAQAMGLSPGSTCVLQAAGHSGQQNALDLDLIGTLNNANAFEAKRFAHVPLKYAQTLLRMPGRVTEYTVAVDKVENIESAASALREALGGDYVVETWSQLQPNVADVIRFQSVVVGIVAMVFLVIVVFGVANTMAMSVMERTREIGTMMALGVRRGRISLLFVLEGAILALWGSTAGAALAWGIEMAIIAGGGIPTAPPGLKAQRFHLIPDILPETVIVVLTMAVLGALGAAAYPAYKAARMRPVEALRAV